MAVTASQAKTLAAFVQRQAVDRENLLAQVSEQLLEARATAEHLALHIHNPGWRKTCRIYRRTLKHALIDTKVRRHRMGK